MKLLCKCIAGSHAYGLNTPQSDQDYRGVFLNLEDSQTIGLERFENYSSKFDTEDSFYMEARNFLNQLKNASPQALELLFTEEFLEMADEWRLVQKYRFDLLDSEKTFKMLKGYIIGEKRLALGERKGKLGGKRYEAVKQYGYSPKNFVNILRLGWAGKIFFEQGNFPVKVTEEGLTKLLLDIKTDPGRFQPNDLLELTAQAEAGLDEAYSKLTVRYTFNHEVANSLCLALYFPILARAFVSNQLCIDNTAIMTAWKH